MKVRKIKPIIVQKLFNKAICERDKRCIICCSSNNLQCSHFYTVGANGILRFHPYNANAMCAKCHIKHHNSDPLFYAEWYKQRPEKLEALYKIKGKTIKYSQVLLKEIITLIKAKDFKGIIKLLEKEAF